MGKISKNSIVYRRYNLFFCFVLVGCIFFTLWKYELISEKTLSRGYERRNKEMELMKYPLLVICIGSIVILGGGLFVTTYINQVGINEDNPLLMLVTESVEIEITVEHKWQEGNIYYFSDIEGFFYHVDIVMKNKDIKHEYLPKVRYDQLIEGERYRITYITYISFLDRTKYSIKENKL